MTAIQPLRERGTPLADICQLSRRRAGSVGGRAGQVVLTQNTSTGLAIVANGVNWRDGDNVVVPAGEFPSNFYPWLQLRRRGVEVREIAMTDGQARVDDLLAAVDDRTGGLVADARMAHLWLHLCGIQGGPVRSVEVRAPSLTCGFVLERSRVNR